MLRITVVPSSAEEVRLRVEGRVIGGWVEELRRTCDVHALYDGIRLTLDLADVSFVDAAGIELLKGTEESLRYPPEPFAVCGRAAQRCEAV